LITKLLLTPLSWDYGLITGFRNLLYDWSILKIYHPGIPTIVVGNMIAGGTGKTPMVAWIAGNLSAKYRVAILSRGYGRRTRGFQLVHKHSSPDAVGDEPLELRLLLPEMTIAVDGNRKRGIQKLTSGDFGKIDLIILDDGFQHRQVKPGFAIVLDNVNRPMRKEKMFPAGLRREPLSSLKRADLIVETKKDISFIPEFPGSQVVLVTGIADSKPLADEIAKKTTLYRHLTFADHHRYTNLDAATIRQAYESCLAEQKTGPDPSSCIILTTGKDYVKLMRLPGLSDLPLYRIPAPPPVGRVEQIEIMKKIDLYVEKTYRHS
jgi:tetraacyldisaccharide 4'-kinase